MKFLLVSDQIDPLIYSTTVKERYGDVDAVTQNTTSGMATPDGDAIITVPGKGQTVATNYTGGSTNSSSNYGESVCVIVRVWLEGEDKDCWNATAGQDFQIALEFAKKTS